MFAFPPIIDTKIDQPEVELVMDRDKVASLGLNMATVGADLATLVGGNFVNRFNLDGRSYKVIPQVKRIERLNANQLESTYVKGPNGQLVPLSTFATLKKKTGPRSLNRFQQFNAVKISGVAIRPLDDALRYLETEAAKILPRGYKLDYTGESRQLRIEGSKFLPAFTLALVLIFLVLAVRPLDVGAFELISVETLDALNLRDHLIAPTVEVEAVHKLSPTSVARSAPTVAMFRPSEATLSRSITSSTSG